MTLQTRISELHRRIEAEHGSGGFLFAAVFCNGCGRGVSAPSPEKLAALLDGWRLADEYGGTDYCPRCSGG